MAGTQLFTIPPFNSLGAFLKVVVTRTFGADKTYVNQVFLIEDCPSSEASKTPQVPQVSQIPQMYQTSRLIEEPLVDSADLKRKLASQLKELDEGMRHMKELMPLPELTQQSTPYSAKRSSVKLVLPKQETQDYLSPNKENCGHAPELERLRSQVKDLNEKVSYLEAQLFDRSPEARTELYEPLHRDTSQHTIKRAESRTSNTTLLYSPTADFRSEFDRHIREWEARVLTPQIKDAMHERKAPAPDLLSKLQIKLNERSRKLEMLESERSRRLKVSSSRRSNS